GQHLISGSANKDQTTMYGAFREQQLEVYDESVTDAHDAKFEREWNSFEETYPLFENFDFEVPENMIGLDGNTMTPTEMIHFIRDFLSLLYDASPPTLE